MKVGIYPATAPKKILAKAVDLLKKRRIGYQILDPKVELPTDLNFIFTLGSDREVLSLLQQIRVAAKYPILGITLKGVEGFLTEISIEQLEETIDALLKQDFFISEQNRLKVESDGWIGYALNDIALFSSRSGTLIEHTLLVDGEFVWRDYSDGVIVATPLGSTAYAMSAGGPLISPNTDVFVIVSVNSLDLTRRPLVINANSKIELIQITSRYSPELIIDGHIRRKINDFVVIRKAKEPAKFVKLKNKEIIFNKIYRKVKFAEEILSLPPSAKFILKILEYEGPLNQKDIIKITMLPARTVRYSLSLLLKKGLIKEKYAIERDARQKIFYLAKE
ncbi:MAG: NAD(+)/NADH kinase [Candidatus Njordarchaeum guaymaensis]